MSKPITPRMKMQVPPCPRTRNVKQLREWYEGYEVARKRFDSLLSSKLSCDAINLSILERYEKLTGHKVASVARCFHWTNPIHAGRAILDTVLIPELDSVAAYREYENASYKAKGMLLEEMAESAGALLKVFPPSQPIMERLRIMSSTWSKERQRQLHAEIDQHVEYIFKQLQEAYDVHDAIAIKLTGLLADAQHGLTYDAYLCKTYDYGVLGATEKMKNAFVRRVLDAFVARYRMTHKQVVAGQIKVFQDHYQGLFTTLNRDFAKQYIRALTEYQVLFSSILAIIGEVSKSLGIEWARIPIPQGLAGNKCPH